MKTVQPLQVKAYENLKKMILEGNFEPGTIYSETRTSKDLGISRTPMRDAIQRLAQEGYIDVIPSKGFCLHEMTQQDLIETYQIRCAIEGYCVVHLANLSEDPETKRVIFTLESLLRDMDAIASTTEDVEDFAHYDAEFHRRIVYSLGNESICEMFDAFFHRMWSQTVMSLRSPGRLKATVAEHGDIIDNIKAGNIEKSYMSTLTHIGQAKALINLEEDI